MTKAVFAFLILTIGILHVGVSQSDTVRLRNPSFEDTPKRGGDDIKGILAWFDCGKINFPAESPPDIHPNGYWENNLPAADGNTYVGMVVRDNGTYESVSQRLDTILVGGKCYRFSINLSRAAKYVSQTRLTGQMDNYITPVVLRIWGGTGFCNEKELLGESQPVNNTSWQINAFEFNPKNNIRYITFEAYYKTPTFLPYNGNLLVDGASDILRVACPGEPPLAAVSNSKLPPHKRTKNKPKAGQSAPISNKNDISKEPVKSFKPKIMQELGINTLKEGQIIEIKKLEFMADTSSINQSSYDVLDEVHSFLMNHPKVMIEIGGHTNNVPSDAYCDKLSTARAKAVAEYLVNKGVEPSKVQFKGYGKKKPVFDNKTAYGRKKNQRVEIKILSLNS